MYIKTAETHHTQDTSMQVHAQKMLTFSDRLEMEQVIKAGAVLKFTTEKP